MIAARIGLRRSMTASAVLRRQRGFTLIEVMVAFAVLAIGLGALTAGITAALRSDAKVQTRHVLDRIAESRLEAAGRATSLKSGRREGRIGRYQWQEIVTPVDLGKSRQQDAAPRPTSQPIPMWVEIVVQAEGGFETRLAALKLAKGAAQ
ncbi:prepilin-type N-terminal cleavage/methylation domain-containing protein [Bradyrhizobium sp. INPA01-394B]|uniref:Prepilin-type N-terminal cleavage/methylation domain-containing protein n=1 Tax=Bradyrhizobium campsiandrae TaxID=1729892 RepID=A0ABR7UCB0_9BRAD|nr:prepilin-type N-terminal cleavage/methylation domain-containing protein [Bradyrhizobium campsiandrae]MBC9882119.1 prepilin-type N-terminal cleavage/methylation domain-containing protein [Bradyrhizobium campsiandrae]MBC9981057.1 prepilin-type N-terminal cleavage/methylation domain-containing protein [Bradyrhizobium campsiandrae]